jgi:hypothetical protein
MTTNLIILALLGVSFIQILIIKVKLDSHCERIKFLEACVKSLAENKKKEHEATEFEKVKGLLK